MKLHHFRHVVAIAEQGSLRGAARSMQLAQPALTRSLVELERELKTPLFERRARGMIPTPVGRAFIQRASTVLNEVRKAQDEVDQLVGGTGGTIAVGLSIAAHIALLPKALTPFRVRYPAVQLHIIEGYYPTLEVGLRSGLVDFYVGPQPETTLPPGLQQTQLFKNTRTIVCRKGHPLGSAQSLRDLAPAEWATTSITSRADEEFRSLFEAHGLAPPRLVLQSQSALTLAISIACTDLLAMVPIQWTAFALAGEALGRIDVRETLPAPSIVAIRRSDVPLTPAASYLLDLMQRTAPRANKKSGQADKHVRVEAAVPRD